MPQAGKGRRGRRTAKTRSNERLMNLVLLFSSARKPLATSTVIADSDLGYGSGNPASDQRKFRRDRAELAALGFHVREVAGAGGAQNTESSWELDRAATYAELPALPADDLLTLIHGIEMHLRRPLLPYRDELARALEKLRAVCACSLGTEAASDDDKDTPSHQQLRAERPARIALSILWTGWRERRAVPLRYRRADGTASKRLVALYGMFSENGFLYLVGADFAQEGAPVRTFRADRVLAAGKPTQPYEIPADFSVDAYRFFSFALGAGEKHPVTFSFPATLPAAERVRITHGAGTLEPRGEVVLWTVEARNYDAACSYAFEHAGRGMRPVAPTELVSCWNDRIAKAVGAYGRVG